jgi:hypothetical protein
MERYAVYMSAKNRTYDHSTMAIINDVEGESDALTKANELCRKTFKTQHGYRSHVVMVILIPDN